MARRVWTKEDDASLTALWATEMGVASIAGLLGFDEKTTYQHARKLRLPSRDTRNCVAPYEAPPQRANRDDDYVAACLDQGGFKVLRIEYPR